MLGKQDHGKLLGIVMGAARVSASLDKYVLTLVRPVRVYRENEMNGARSTVRVKESGIVVAV